MKISDLYAVYNGMNDPQNGENNKKLLLANMDLLVTTAKNDVMALATGASKEYCDSGNAEKAKPQALILLKRLGREQLGWLRSVSQQIKPEHEPVFGWVGRGDWSDPATRQRNAQECIEGLNRAKDQRNTSKKEAQRNDWITSLYDAYKHLQDPNKQQLLRDNLDALINAAKTELQKLAERDALDALLEVKDWSSSPSSQYFYSNNVAKAKPQALVLLTLLYYGDQSKPGSKELLKSALSIGADTEKDLKESDMLKDARKTFLATLTPLQLDYMRNTEIFGLVPGVDRDSDIKERAKKVLYERFRNVESAHQSWVKRSQVSTLFNAHFVNQMHAEAEKDLKAKEKPGVEATLDAVAKANLKGLFTVLAKNFAKAQVVFQDAEAFGYNLLETLIHQSFAELSYFNAMKEVKNLHPSFLQAYNKHIVGIKAFKDGKFVKQGDVAKLTDEHPGAAILKLSGSLNGDIYGYRKSIDKGVMLHNIIIQHRIHIEMLEIYAKHLQNNPKFLQEPELNSELQAHLKDRKAKLYALEMVCTRSDTTAAAIGKRAIGFGAGALPGLITAGGSAIGLAFDNETKKVAMEALQDLGKGLFDKFREGLVAGNPILVSLCVGLCLGAFGAFLSAVSAAEAVAHYKHQPEAIKLFEKILLDKSSKRLI
ncbi:MAG: hypothetical protein JSS50_04230 [Proteobacteria bacterium]|nr:hypothetical protein [Pseudomonadota bacterium]